MHNQSQMLKKVLKQQIRIRGLRYKDIAQHLGINVITVKRYLNSQRLPIEYLEELCSCLGLSLIELAEIAKAEEWRNDREIELQQEAELAADPALALLRLLLYSGLTYEEIRAEYAIEETDLIGLMTRLDRLRLIELLPGNRVRIRGPRNIDWPRGGAMRNIIQDHIRNDFVSMDFANTDEFYAFETARLSDTSIEQVEEQMRQLARTVRVLHQVDQSLMASRKRWYSVLIAKQETRWTFRMPTGEKYPSRSG